MDVRKVALLFALLFASAPATAQQGVTLNFQGGLVTLRAQNAPVRAILAEWARLGGTTFVNGDKVVGPPVTLELTAVPERQALDIVLRNAAGYMLAPRRATTVGPSAFDRVMILATSAAPRNPPSGAAGGGGRPGMPRTAVMPRPPEPQEIPSEISQPDEVITEGESQPQPDPRRIPRPFIRRPMPGGDEPADPQDTGAPTGAPVPGAPTPANPFGIPIGSSATPGVVSPPPPPPPANRVQ